MPHIDSIATLQQYFVVWDTQTDCENNKKNQYCKDMTTKNTINNWKNVNHFGKMSKQQRQNQGQPAYESSASMQKTALKKKK